MPITNVADLDTHLRSGRTRPAGYPAGQRTFFAPYDDVHGVLGDVLELAATSLILVMFGFDDQALADQVKTALEDPGCYVQITLDAREAGTATEKRILTAEGYPASSLAVGHSEFGDIIHEKVAVVNGEWTISGSTNWSAGGEGKQDNELRVTQDPYIAAEYAARASAIHANVLNQRHPTLGTPLDQGGDTTR